MEVPGQKVLSQRVEGLFLCTQTLRWGCHGDGTVPWSAILVGDGGQTAQGHNYLGTAVVP